MANPKQTRLFQQAFGEAAALFGQGRLDDAAARCDQALAALPKMPDALHLRGLIAFRRGQPEAAERDLRAARAAQPRNAELAGNHGIVLAALGMYREALAADDAALALAADKADIWSNRGHVLKLLGRNDEALVSYERALAIEPERVEAIAGRANVLIDLGRADEARDACDRILASRADYVSAWSTRGNALCALGQFDAALASYERAIAIKPDFAEAWSNRGNALRDLGRLADAADSYRRALAVRPDDNEAEFNLALVLLLGGDFAAGWRHYEARWRHPAARAELRSFAMPAWTGAEPLAGKTLLLHAEQGYGDTIQFCRYAPLLAARGARVLLEAPAALLPALDGLDGVERLIARGEPLPEADYHLPLMSLPLVCGTTPATVPAPVAYLRADPRRVAAWAARLDAPSAGDTHGLDRGADRGAKPRVGIVWSGRPTHANDRHRSLRFDALAPLLSLPLRFVSLQTPVREADRAALGSAPQVLDLDGALADFGDTAAVLDQLDLLISVDTSTAHLAAALGKPVWLLLPFNPDFRWMLGRDDSPWYPSMRLFRQAGPGRWPELVADVRAALVAHFGLDTGSAAVAGDAPGATGASTSPFPGRLVFPGLETTCKICGHRAELEGVVDFAKNCEEVHGVHLPLTAVPIYYHRCTECGLLFTTAFDAWDKADYLAHIYNDAYIEVDPDYGGARALASANWLAHQVGDLRERRVLDYGGGNGRLAAELRGRGVQASSWDPMADGAAPPASGAYDLVTAFEVFEHTPTPQATVADICALLDKAGVLVFSTLLIDDLPRRAVHHWYVAPRNGHVSIYTRHALRALFAPFGMQVEHIDDNLHVAFRQRPAWLTAT